MNNFRFFHKEHKDQVTTFALFKKTISVFINLPTTIEYEKLQIMEKSVK